MLHESNDDIVTAVVRVFLSEHSGHCCSQAYPHEGSAAKTVRRQSRFAGAGSR